MKIKIRYCHGLGPEFGRLISGSVHETVKAPSGHESLPGVWVMGKTQPVHLLPGDYIVVKEGGEQ